MNHRIFLLQALLLHGQTEVYFGHIPLSYFFNIEIYYKEIKEISSG